MTFKIRVLTWNVHGGLGLDGVRDFSRIADHIAATGADIVALQEVDGRDRRGKSAPMTILRDRLGHEGVSVSAISAPDGDYGQVLMCRWPLVEVEKHNLSVGRFEPRCAIAATANTPRGGVRLVATHLGLRFGERQRQIAALCQAIEDERPMVLMGDFNDWTGYRSAQTPLKRHFAGHTTIRTFPARLPVLALDRLYYRPAGLLTGARAIRTAPLLSDHLPLLAELILRA
jgi:endonuclease/exonuclease/phosphatase family metal-dependent hydrolase